MFSHTLPLYYVWSLFVYQGQADPPGRDRDAEGRTAQAHGRSVQDQESEERIHDCWPEEETTGNQPLRIVYFINPPNKHVNGAQRSPGAG